MCIAKYDMISIKCVSLFYVETERRVQCQLRRALVCAPPRALQIAQWDCALLCLSPYVFVFMHAPLLTRWDLFSHSQQNVKLDDDSDCKPQQDPHLEPHIYAGEFYVSSCLIVLNQAPVSHFYSINEKTTAKPTNKPTKKPTDDPVSFFSCFLPSLLLGIIHLTPCAWIKWYRHFRLLCIQWVNCILTYNWGFLYCCTRNSQHLISAMQITYHLIHSL